MKGLITLTSDGTLGLSHSGALCDTTVAAFTVTLPHAANTVDLEDPIIIKKIAGFYTVTVDALSGLIEDESSVPITPIGESLSFVSDGTNYHVV